MSPSPPGRAAFLSWVMAMLAVVSGRADATFPSAIVGRQPRVLVLFSNERLLPANVEVDRAIRSTFQSEFRDPVEFYSEFLDGDRFPGYAERTRDFLRDKYRERPPDLIIAGGSRALGFLMTFRENMLGGIPIIHLAVSQRSLPASFPDDAIVGVPLDTSLASTMELALRVQPETRHVAIVDGAVDSSSLAMGELMPFTNQVNLLWLTNRVLSELREELKTLPDRTVVLYGTIFRDAGGNAFTPQAALDQFARASRAPIYGNYDTYFGHGVVGGSMITFEAMGRTAARIGIRILSGQRPQDAVRGMDHPPAPMFDARELERWGIREELLPRNSVVLFRPASLWREHRTTVGLGLGTVAVQSWLIGLLLIQRNRRRRVESELRESETRFRSLAEHAPVMICVSDPDLKLTYFNQCWLKFTGRSLAEEQGGRWTTNVHPDDRPAALACFEGTRTAQASVAIEYRLRRQDGEYRWILATAAPRRGVDGVFLGYVASCVDLTDRKRMEETNRSLAHADRISTMGQLAAALAHELSQPLGAILRNAEAGELLMKQTPPDLDEITAILKDIRRDDRRASSVIDRLRALLQRRPVELEALDLKVLCQEVVDLVRPELTSRRIGIRISIPDDLPRVMGDRVHLQQVLLNLVVNGADAMTTTPEPLRKLEIHARRLDPETIEVAVSDSGQGIPPDRLPRLFEPFYTTKSDGMGMGLSIVRTLVESHGGRVTAENNPGGGATLRFTLGVAMESAETGLVVGMNPKAREAIGGSVP